MTDRRAFMTALVAGALVAGRRGTAAAARQTSMYLAYTSFAVRMAQGRDILKSTAATLDPEMFRALCANFGAGGAQIDLSQVSGQLDALAAVRDAFGRDGIGLEASIPARYLESPDTFAQAVSVARALGARCGRVALLSGRRYESFETAAAWSTFTTKWRETLLRMRPEFERHRFPIGIENHKDWLAPELVALLEAIDSPYVGACLDFGNNLALLEDPDETIALLAPFAVTTHLKDMAVRRTTQGFELSEVPLGQGILPLGRYVAAVRRARPEAQLCLEMITRDPLSVPYHTDRFWVAFDAGARRRERLRQFEATVLAQSRDALPQVAGLSPTARLAAEDDNVRACVVHARDVLKLEAD